MEDRHRDAIQMNFSTLVEQTDLNDMVSLLYEKGVFSERMIEPYKDNRDERSRKRDLYMDIMRRGPLAFGHLVDALTERGYWDIARSLDPDSPLHRHKRQDSSSEDSEYLSIKNEKKKSKNKSERKIVKPPQPPPSTEKPPVPVITKNLDPTRNVPHFNVIKSTKFFENNDTDMPVYWTRGRRRGVLVVFSFTEFDHNVDEPREGADVDCANLKYLFLEMGFSVVSYWNLSKKATLEILESLKAEVSNSECLFLVVSSHGYERDSSSDIDIRCSDGVLIPSHEIITIFNNANFPQFYGKPKVFIFQTCRGNLQGEHFMRVADAGPANVAGGGRTRADGSPWSDSGARDRRSPAPAQLKPDRTYSDILIAHSTLPRHASYRDTKHGSWYIQTLCDVFAKRAHDTHVDTLFTLVDDQLYRKYHVQTSSVDKWGFNRRLYLHPGLYEDSLDTDGAYTNGDSMRNS